jgi:hypothetical protein
MLAAGTLAGTAWAEAPAVPKVSLEKAVEGVEKATRNVRTLRADYVRTYLVEGREGRFREEGTFSWKRTADGAWARWDGKDEKGPVLTLVRDGKLTVWRGKRKEREASLVEASLRHASKYGFPLVPSDWKKAWTVADFRQSPEYDARLPLWSPKGIPTGLVFKPRVRRSALKAVTLQFDAETGLAHRLRCDTYLWDMFWFDLGEWELNPALPDALFDPPDKESEKEPDGKDGAKKGAAPAKKS